MNILEWDVVLLICEGCLLAYPAIGDQNPSGNHKHAQFSEEHPLSECSGTMRKINLVEFIRRSEEEKRISAKLEQATNRLKNIDAAFHNDRKLLQTLIGRMRLPAVGKTVQTTLEKLPKIVEDSKIPLRAEIARLKLSPDFDSSYVKENRKVAENLIETDQRWSAWRSSAKLQTSPATNYDLLPYPEPADFEVPQVCSHCDEGAPILNMEHPQIGRHIDASTGTDCVNSTLLLSRQDLCTISRNCRASTMTLHSEITAVSLDSTKFGQPVILQDGTVVPYGSRPHIDALNSNEKPDRPY